MTKPINPYWDFEPSQEPVVPLWVSAWHSLAREHPILATDSICDRPKVEKLSEEQLRTIVRSILDDAHGDLILAALTERAARRKGGRQ